MCANCGCRGDETTLLDLQTGKTTMIAGPHRHATDVGQSQGHDDGHGHSHRHDHDHHVRKVNPEATIQQVSARTGEGTAAWYDWLRTQLAATRQSAFA